MHNRARLVVGSFLTKDLGIDWRWGERWFMRLLIDGDEANNNGNWQWIASVGVDPQPVSRRIFNPTRQQARFDPDGDYVRRYVPELRGVPDQLPGGAVDDARRGPARSAASSAVTTRSRSSTTRRARREALAALRSRLGRGHEQVVARRPAGTGRSSALDRASATNCARASDSIPAIEALNLQLRNR